MTKKKITALVVWSVNVEVELEEGLPEEDCREEIFCEAEKEKAFCRLDGPVIHDCSDPDLID